MFLENYFVEEDNNKWLNTLNLQQQDTINKLLSKNSEDEVITIWLNSLNINTATYNGGNTDFTYSNLFKNEVIKLLCGDKKYKVERGEINNLYNSTNIKKAIITYVSGVIASQLNVSSTSIAPVVVLMFIIISKLSLNAWCQLNK